jgi:hypothetical protein
VAAGRGAKRAVGFLLDSGVHMSHDDHDKVNGTSMPSDRPGSCMKHRAGGICRTISNTNIRPGACTLHMSPPANIRQGTGSECTYSSVICTRTTNPLHSNTCLGDSTRVGIRPVVARDDAISPLSAPGEAIRPAVVRNRGPGILDDGCFERLAAAGQAAS